ncbi:hypothetical protein DITRI_Ditri01bG0129800 [Diplodiscus trichospermus]
MEKINVTASSDLDMKINAILSIIVQDDGDSFAKRAEMYYQKRPELIQMVEDLHKSYRSLAEKYDQLRSEVNSDSHPKLLSLSRSVNHVQRQRNSDEDKELSGEQYSNFHSKSSAEEPDDDHETELDDDSSKIKQYDKNQERKSITGIAFQRNTSDSSQAAMLENEKLWNELRFKVSELVEDNLSHQAELIRRNDEKREMIRDLCSKMNMVDEKSKSSPASHKVLKKSQSSLSRLKRAFWFMR